jgi:hypothetical protein
MLLLFWQNVYKAQAQGSRKVMFRNKIAIGFFSSLLALHAWAEEQPVTTESEPEPGTLEQLKNDLSNNAVISLKGMVNKYFHSSSLLPDAANSTAGSILTIKNHAYLDNSYLSFELFALESTLSEASQGVFSDPCNSSGKNKYLDFSKVYWQNQSDNYDFLLGQDILEGGVAGMYSMATTLTSYNTAVDIHPVPMGVWQARLDYYFENNDKLTLAVLPFDRRPSQSPLNSRWGLNTEISSIIPLPVGGFENLVPTDSTINTSDRSPAIENWNYLLRYDTLRDGYEIYGQAYVGTNQNYVLRYDRPENITLDVFEQVQPRGYKLAAGARKVFNAWQVYTEAMYQYSRHQEDQNWVQNLLGISYKDTKLAGKFGLEHITPNIEIVYEEITRKQDSVSILSDSADGFVISSEPTRPIKKDILFKVEVAKSYKLKFWAGLDYDYQNYGRAYVFGTLYSPIDKLDLFAAVALLAGPDTSIWGFYSDNDFMQTGFKFTF